MIDGKRVVVFIPAGRKRYMEILLPYILREKHVVDECRIWKNTGNQEDVVFFEGVRKNNTDVVSVVSHQLSGDMWKNFHMMYRDLIEDDTVYVKIDDDIVFMEEGFIESLVRFRISNPEYPIVFGNTVNNGIFAHIHQRIEALDWRKGVLHYHISSVEGAGERIHRQLLSQIEQDDLQVYRFPRWILYGDGRISINCISWLGEEFKRFGGNIGGQDDEQWLSVDLPRITGRPNCFHGGPIVAHYAYRWQRQQLDGTDVLARYKEICQKKMGVVSW